MLSIRAVAPTVLGRNIQDRVELIAGRPMAMRVDKTAVGEQRRLQLLHYVLRLACAAGDAHQICRQAAEPRPEVVQFQIAADYAHCLLRSSRVPAGRCRCNKTGDLQIVAARPTPEQKARHLIDAQLEAAGWVIRDRNDMSRSAATGVAVREYPTGRGLQGLTDGQGAERPSKAAHATRVSAAPP